jgi:NADH-quinone oxidoreductase subunit E
MLSQEEKDAIDREIQQYPDRQGACIEALKIVQRARRWISDESLKDIAEYLRMSPDHLDSVATFYNLIFRKPVGDHIILICDSVSCWICGCESIKAAIRDKLEIEPGETTPDGRFTLLPIQCLGTCDRAPALMIDDNLYQDLDQQKIKEVLTKYQKDHDGNTDTSN